MMTALAADHLGGKTGIMCPIPQYPLYSALTTLIDGDLVGYYLDESKGWAISEAELRKAYDEAEARGTKTRALVIINPGNPSGANLDDATLEAVVRFAHEKKLVLMADEVYQENVFTDHPFKSLSRVVRELNLPVEITSMHSLSKGFLGECGVRGGYATIEIFDPDVLAQLVKLKSIELCSNTIGQLSVSMVRLAVGRREAALRRRGQIGAGGLGRARRHPDIDDEHPRRHPDAADWWRHTRSRRSSCQRAQAAADKACRRTSSIACRRSRRPACGRAGLGLQAGAGDLPLPYDLLAAYRQMEKALSAFSTFHNDFMAKHKAL